MQAQFPANMVEFLDLRRIQIILRRFEIGAGVRHVFVEPEPVKVIGNVEVLVDRAPVAFPRMSAAVQLTAAMHRKMGMRVRRQLQQHRA